MSEETKQSTDTENQAKDEFDNIDFGDEDVPSETPTDQSPTEKQAPDDKEEFINQEAVNKRINEITFQKYEEKRKREELEAQLDQLKKKLEAQNKQSEDIEIPALPDVYDDDYAEKLKQREAALQKAAEIKARKAMMQEQEQRILTERIKRQQDEISKKAQEMFDNGKKLGISEEELTKADQTVAAFIKDAGLAKFILDQKDSALIVKYLSSSATELEKLSVMDPIHASVRIATKIAPQAMKLKPDITQTPDPLEIPKGKPVPQDDPYLKGVSFE